jgi:hypothetical protein
VLAAYHAHEAPHAHTSADAGGVNLPSIDVFNMNRPRPCTTGSVNFYTGGSENTCDEQSCSPRRAKTNFYSGESQPSLGAALSTHRSATHAVRDTLRAQIAAKLSTAPESVARAWRPQSPDRRSWPAKYECPPPKITNDLTNEKTREVLARQAKAHTYRTALDAQAVSDAALKAVCEAPGGSSSERCQSPLGSTQGRFLAFGASNNQNKYLDDACRQRHEAAAAAVERQARQAEEEAAEILKPLPSSAQGHVHSREVEGEAAAAAVAVQLADIEAARPQSERGMRPVQMNDAIHKALPSERAYKVGLVVFCFLASVF